jgi:hypothetical protein
MKNARNTLLGLVTLLASGASAQAFETGLYVGNTGLLGRACEVRVTRNSTSKTYDFDAQLASGDKRLAFEGADVSQLLKTGRLSLTQDHDQGMFSQVLAVTTTLAARLDKHGDLESVAIRSRARFLISVRSEKVVCRDLRLLR